MAKKHEAKDIFEPIADPKGPISLDAAQFRVAHQQKHGSLDPSRTYGIHASQEADLAAARARYEKAPDLPTGDDRNSLWSRLPQPVRTAIGATAVVAVLGIVGNIDRTTAENEIRANPANQHHVDPAEFGAPVVSNEAMEANQAQPIVPRVELP